VISLSDLRTEHLREPRGLWTARPRFSWILSATNDDVMQASYELEVRREGEAQPLWRSGRVDSQESVLVGFGGEDLASSTRYSWRVRVEAGREQSAWSESAFETSLLSRDEWVADFVEPVQVSVAPDGLRRRSGEWVAPEPRAPEERLHPAKYLRQTFELADRPVRARLYCAAHGVYASELNGVVVGDQVLAPGYESYDKRLSFQSYDVTDLLTSGRNALGVILGDGWYAGRIDFTGTSAQYGDRLQAGWQVLVEYDDGRHQVVRSDKTVVSSTEGPIRYSDLSIGEKYDARLDISGWSSPAFDDSHWTPVKIVASPAVLSPFVGEPVRRVEAITPKEVLTTPAGDLVVDFGQVIAGVVHLTVRGSRGTTVKLEHTEVLDRDGNFFNNVAGLNKDQTDYYVLAGSTEPETWTPLFTFHGFRYVRVSGYPGEPQAANFLALVIGSDLERSSAFSCSDPRITQLHRNAVWSQRGNFLSIPTDCPQRERMGWTGDLQIFAPAATRNNKVVPFLARWLENVRADQEPDGLVPVIVPAPPFMNSLSGQLADDPLFSIRAAAGWGDAVVLVPWLLFQRYGDRRVLGDNYDAMQAWVDRQIRVAESELPARLHDLELSPERAARQRLLWNSEPNFGDWNAPSMKVEDPSLDHALSVATRSGELIAPMFHGWSLGVLAEAAAELGRESDAEYYLDRSRRVRQAFAEEYLDDSGRLPFDRQGAYVLALAFRFIPEEKLTAYTDRLVELVHAAGDHLDTGFLSVPYLLDVLWTHGHQDLARTLLWQDSAPSWLYEVDHGATTMWEEWEAVGPDGTVTSGSMNHYAFGCVDEWLQARLGGIEPTSPGYRTARIEPDFHAPLTWVEASQETPYGSLDVRWNRDLTDTEQLTLEVGIPANTVASVVLPKGAGSVRVLRGGRPAAVALDELGSGNTVISFRLDPAGPTHSEQKGDK